MKIVIDGFANGAAIPAKFAFGKIPSEGRFALSDNINPKIEWSDAPNETKSFVLICHDPDVPSSGENVNQEGRTVPADLPRVDFFHWVLIDIPPATTEIAEGADSNGITVRGKASGQRPYGKNGINSYTDWFSGDVDMEGYYGGYDGPCPPWNDSIVHHYHFTVYALGVSSLGLDGNFTGVDALSAMQQHILDKASYVGTYSMNPEVAAV